jgi:hypothetical protein
MSVLEKLTEGIRERSLAREGQALMEKWERTGLLEGIEDDHNRNGMAMLLENQAKQLLKEASTMAGGDVEGFSAVAFPLVRRVFGGLLANDLVSVQPMSLPSGLIFFMDFQYTDSTLGFDANDSLYGGGVVATQLTGGVTDLTEEGGGFYNLQTGYTSPTGSATIQMDNQTLSSTLVTSLTEAQKKLIRWDPDILGTTTNYVSIVTSDDTVTDALANVNTDNLIAMDFTAGTFDLGNGTPVRRLTYLDSNSKLNLVLVRDGGAIDDVGNTETLTVAYPERDLYATADVGSVRGSSFPLEGSPDLASGTTGLNVDIPEIDIKVGSVAVTAITKKLKARWSPELAQDLNAYHNLDAEVELTQILSEQIALEIDREILNDLVQGAKAGTYYWSRSPGLFVHRTNGTELGATAAAPDFTGTVSEWYETLVETINDVSAQIHRKTLRGGANFLVCSPEVANILEFTAGFRASVTADDNKGTVGAVKVGSLSKKWDIHVDPYFPRNLCLVGRKGGSFLESGYVYAPYVPLQVTPTIFGVEDFTPRKGVMTRYAKKMVRPDMYGLVVVRGILGESGAS